MTDITLALQQKCQDGSKQLLLRIYGKNSKEFAIPVAQSGGLAKRVRPENRRCYYKHSQTEVLLVRQDWALLS
jgi:hypothetical protein